MVRFLPYVVRNTNEAKVSVTTKKATAQDLSITTANPKWQTDWNSDYITKSGFDLYAFRTRDGELMAFGIKLSVNVGHNGDVILDAKSPELAAHYELEFGTVRLPGRNSAVDPRHLICDEAAMDIFISYLKEG